MKINTVRTALQKAHPVIDQLVDSFINNGWNYLPEDPTAKFSRYGFEYSNLLHPRLADDRLDTDRLGRYLIEDCEYDEPGRRILFAPSILKGAEYLHKHLPEISLQSVIDALTAIVALHESAHWIMHSFTSPSGNRISKEGPFDVSTHRFDEGLAQLFTQKALAQDTVMTAVFDELCKHQPKVYSLFRESASYGIVHILDQLADPVVLRSQSWELLSECLGESDKDLAIRNYIDKATPDDTFERFRLVLRTHRPDLSDGPHNTGRYRGRIIATAYGM